MPRPSKSIAMVRRDGVSLRVQEVASTMARMRPSVPAHPRVLGASMYAISEVTGRAAKPMLLVLTHRAPTLGDPGSSIRPSMTPFCHSEKRLGSPWARRRRPIHLIAAWRRRSDPPGAARMRVALEGATGSAGRTESTSESLHTLAVASSSA